MEKSVLPGGSNDKASACCAGDPGLIPGLGRSPGEGNGNPLQHSCLENPMHEGAWKATVSGITKSRTQLSGFSFSVSVWEEAFDHCIVSPGSIFFEVFAFFFFSFFIPQHSLCAFGGIFSLRPEWFFQASSYILKCQRCF